MLERFHVWYWLIEFGGVLPSYFTEASLNQTGRLVQASLQDNSLLHAMGQET